MVTEGFNQDRPINGVIDAARVNDDRLIFKKSTGVSHTFLQGLHQRSGIGVLEYYANGIEGGTFKVEGSGVGSHRDDHTSGPCCPSVFEGGYAVKNGFF